MELRDQEDKDMCLLEELMPSLEETEEEPSRNNRIRRKLC
jgi:hypothetical protein